VGVGQHAPADAQHQGAVTAHQRGEGFFFPSRREAFQELLIGLFGGRAERSQGAELSQENLCLDRSHDDGPVEKVEEYLSS
jgi:hypothetical protein